MNAYYNSWYTTLTCVDTVVNLINEINHVTILNLQKNDLNFERNGFTIKADFGVETSFIVWYTYAITEAIISDVLIPVLIFFNLR